MNTQASLQTPLRPFLHSLLLLLMVAGASGCTTFRMASESLFLISPAEELQLGREVKTKIDQEVSFVSDPTVVDYVRTLGNRLVTYAPDSEFDPQFYVVSDKEINAFAIPAGSVYVQTGLINAADDEAELAAVVAHELGHVIRRHSARGLARNTGANLAGQLLLGENYGSAAEMISSLGLLSYTREDEAESDEIAVGTLHRAGYDPGALATFFSKLKERYGDQGRIASFFASHPPTTERIQNVEALVRTLPEGKANRPTTDLRRVQGRLKQLGLAD